MLHHGFAAAEGAGHGGHAALGHGKEGVDNPLAGDHGLAGRELGFIGASPPHGPFLQHGQIDFAPLGFETGDGREDVVFALGDPNDLAANARGHHHLVQHRFGFLYCTQHVAGRYLIADLGHGRKGPEFFVVEGIHHHAAVDAVARLLADLIEGALDAVVNRFDEARGQLHAKRRAGGFHGLARADAARFFVYLDRGLVAAQLDDFADELLFGNAHHVVHLHICHAAGDDQRAGHFDDSSLGCHLFLLRKKNIRANRLFDIGFDVGHRHAGAAMCIRDGDDGGEGFGFILLHRFPASRKKRLGQKDDLVFLPGQAVDEPRGLIRIRFWENGQAYCFGQEHGIPLANYGKIAFFTSHITYAAFP